MKISTNPAAVQALQAAAQQLKTANVAALEQLAADVRLEFEMEKLQAERQRNPQGSEMVSYTNLELARNAKPSVKTWNFVYNGARMVNVTTRDMYPVNIMKSWSMWLSALKLSRPMSYAHALEILRREYMSNPKMKDRLDQAAQNLRNGQKLNITYSSQAPAIPRHRWNVQALEYAVKRLSQNLPLTASLEPFNTEPMLDVQTLEEVSQTGKTAHFQASETATGYGIVYVNGDPVTRTRVWATQDTPSIETLYHMLRSWLKKSRTLKTLKYTLAYSLPMLESMNEQDTTPSVTKRENVDKPAAIKRRLINGQHYTLECQGFILEGRGTRTGETWAKLHI
jgi:hypothetical protein